MTKIRTLEQLQGVLDKDLAWRKKELAIIKSLVTSKGSKEIINCHIRSGIALVYAHWEGFIKEAGNAYIAFVSSQKLTYSQLSNNFIAMGAKKLLNEARDSNKATIYTKLTDFFMYRLAEKCTLPNEIDTKSNLSSEVLKEIIHILGLDYREYEIKSMVIDENLLRSRNNIAHGNYLVMEVDQFVELHETMINLMNLFSNQISNAANTKAYQSNSQSS